MQLMAPKGISGCNPVCPVDGFQQAVHGSHSKINSEDKTKEKKRRVFDFRYMGKVGVGNINHIDWNNSL